MNVLMLGWEYPPHIAGGLGTACEGLTRALARQQVAVNFVMPHVVGDEQAEHMTLTDTDTFAQTGNEDLETHDEHYAGAPGESSPVKRYRVPAALRPYWSEAEYAAETRSASELVAEVEGAAASLAPGIQPGGRKAVRPRYGHDIFAEVLRFTDGALRVSRGKRADVIHAHDWMTLPAGVALHERTGAPLVVHVHSLEYDRSGHNGMNPRIRAVEGMGLARANAVIAVSHYTKGIICREYGVDPKKVHVVHNGIYERQVVRHYQAKHPDWPKHVVLFLGRVTFQKGPDYFVQAAAKVVPHVPDVLFVVAGSGDMLGQVKQLARDLGVEKHFYFPGFLRGNAVEEMFSVADLYVMPSVSEPFGISALEAINFDVPVLVSKQSGVAEVVGHSLKFDFWDVNRFADLIINGLVHEELRADMIEMARKELARVRWDASASKVIHLYRQLAG